jgi:hypothetical protein
MIQIPNFARLTFSDRPKGVIVISGCHIAEVIEFFLVQFDFGALYRRKGKMIIGDWIGGPDWMDGKAW